MTELDIDFLEEYKRFEKTLNDAYSCQHGVGGYIDRMINAPGGAELLVPGWNEDLKTLKHLRWVRNQIAHDADGNSYAEEGDAEKLADFHDRILSGSDPLTLLKKALEAQVRRKRTGTAKKSGAAKKKDAPVGARTPTPERESDGRTVGIIIGVTAAVLAVVAAALIVLFLR